MALFVNIHLKYDGERDKWIEMCLLGGKGVVVFIGLLVKN